MRIRIKRHGIEFWRTKMNVIDHMNRSKEWHIWTLFFNPVEQLRQFIWVQIDEAFRRRGMRNEI
jgi:hypothetical protein